MEPQDINYLINKYSKTPKSSQNDEFYSSPRSSFSPFHEPNSKAYAAAMRALQERIRFLESENTDLYEKFRISEAKFLEEKKVSEKLSQELHSKTNNEIYSNQTISELKNEVSRVKKQNSQLNHEISGLEYNKTSHLQQENLNLKHELDLALRELSNKKGSEIDLLMEIRKLEEEKFALQDELSKEK